MVIILKIILAMLAAANALVFKFLLKDYQSTKKQDGFDELSIWRKLRFNSVFFFLTTSMMSLFAFLIYFIITKITIG